MQQQTLAQRLHDLGITDPKAVILHATGDGSVGFPVPVATFHGKHSRPGRCNRIPATIAMVTPPKFDK